NCLVLIKFTIDFRHHRPPPVPPKKGGMAMTSRAPIHVLPELPKGLVDLRVRDRIMIPPKGHGFLPAWRAWRPRQLRVSSLGPQPRSCRKSLSDASARAAASLPVYVSMTQVKPATASRYLWALR